MCVCVWVVMVGEDRMGLSPHNLMTCTRVCEELVSENISVSTYFASDLAREETLLNVHRIHKNAARQTYTTCVSHSTLFPLARSFHSDQVFPEAKPYPLPFPPPPPPTAEHNELGIQPAVAAWAVGLWSAISLATAIADADEVCLCLSDSAFREHQH